MTRASRLTAAGLAAALLVTAGLVLVAAQGPTADLPGAVRIAKPVLADGKPLAAGTYRLRLSTAPVTPVLGQPEGSAVWVEVLQGDEVKGRELATVVLPAEVTAIQKEGDPPPAGRARVDVLAGGDYLRVWVNRAGTHYLIHLAIVKTKF